MRGESKSADEVGVSVEPDEADEEAFLLEGVLAVGLNSMAVGLSRLRPLLDDVGRAISQFSLDRRICCGRHADERGGTGTLAPLHNDEELQRVRAQGWLALVLAGCGGQRWRDVVSTRRHDQYLEEGGHTSKFHCRSKSAWMF